MNVLTALLTIPVTISEAMNMLVAAVTGFVIGTFVAFIIFSLVGANARDPEPSDEPAWDDGDEPK